MTFAETYSQAENRNTTFNFYSYSRNGYLEKLRSFLALPRTFKQDCGIAIPRTERKQPAGAERISRYSDEGIESLEAMANQKAARAEATDTPLAERLQIAKDYAGVTDAALSREVGYSRELIRRWGGGLSKPTAESLAHCAAFLNVPLAWLQEGGEDSLPAWSHVGMRVGAEAQTWKEQLYGLTTWWYGDIPDDCSVEEAQARLEYAVLTEPKMRNAARKAGGRWQTLGSLLVFSPWAPIEEHGLVRRYWTDEVEAIVQEELAKPQSIYRAHKNLEARCKAMGLQSDAYPKLISLHKRVDKDKERANKYGIDLNAPVATAVATYMNFDMDESED